MNVARRLCRLARSVTVVALLVAPIAMTTACGSGDELKEVPEMVRGEWTTESTEYAGRAFHLSAHELTIVIDANTKYVHTIDRIEVRERNGRPFMTFHHKNRDGVDDTFRFEFAEYPTTFIRLEHLDRIRWHRNDESGVELAAGL